MVSPRLAVASAILAIAFSPLDALHVTSEANPIRKVVNLLQSMQKKVTEEGLKEKELYEKFMCYCKTGNDDLSASISAAEEKAPLVSADIESSEQKLTQTKADLKSAQEDRTAAKKAMSEAKALREKEAAQYASEKADYDANTAAIAKAVTALEKGMAGGFLQTQSAQILRAAIAKQDTMDGDVDRQEVMAFLSGTQSSSYAPSSGEITGILKQMGDNMAKTLSSLTSDEDDAIKTYDALMASKTKETAALTASIERKTKLVGDLGVRIVQMKGDLSDTESALAQDKEFLANLENSCKTKTSEWEERSKTRSDELVALADTIKVLNDDDALELFKKTLPSASAASASLLQVSSRATVVRSRALAALHRAKGHPGLDFLALALSGQKSLQSGGFDKVVAMIDKMVAALKQEQVDDNNKREYCGVQLDQTDDKKKALSRSIDDTENSIATASDAISTLKEEISKLEADIKELDKSVAEATEQRKAENTEYKELMASDGAAKELLGFAKNRLNQFYNPKLYKPAPKRELSREDRIAVNLGEKAPPTEAPGGIAGTGISFTQIAKGNDAPAAPPATWDAYKSKSQENGGVIAMINLLVNDLDKEMTEAEAEEKNAQSQYTTMMQESAAKRTSDSKSLSGKKSTLADTEGELESLKEAKKSAGSEMMALTKYISTVHAECDWLLQYHEARKEARDSEIDSLQEAKAVLSGADYSMLQTRSKGFLAF